jgi:hypothetical protein
MDFEMTADSAERHEILAALDLPLIGGIGARDRC